MLDRVRPVVTRVQEEQARRMEPAPPLQVAAQRLEGRRTRLVDNVADLEFGRRHRTVTVAAAGAWRAGAIETEAEPRLPVRDRPR